MKPWLLLLVGCPVGPVGTPYESYLYAEAFLYNGDADAPVDVSVWFLPATLDCAILDHPEAAAGLEPTGERLDLTLQPHELVAPWEDAIANRESWTPCYAARVQVGDQIATMVFDLTLGPQDIGMPTEPSDLSHNTLLVASSSDGARFRAGPQEALLTVGDPYPTCELVLPTWHAEPALGATVLAVHQQGTCSVLTLFGDRELRVCDAPPLPYLVGEDLDIDAAPTFLSVRTSSGGKPYLLGRGAGTLPTWLDLRVFRELEDQTDDLRDGVCNVPSSCGPTLPVDPIVSFGGDFRYARWNEPRDVVDPSGSSRRFTVHAAGTGVDRTCPLALSFSLVPAAAP